MTGGLVAGATGTAGWVVYGVSHPTYAAAVIAKGLGKATILAIAEAGEKIGGPAFAKATAKLAAKEATKVTAQVGGYAVSQVSHAYLNKIAATLAVKFTAGQLNGGVVLIGPTVTVAINSYFVLSVGSCAEKYYRAKSQGLRELERRARDTAENLHGRILGEWRGIAGLTGELKIKLCLHQGDVGGRIDYLSIPKSGIMYDVILVAVEPDLILARIRAKSGVREDGVARLKLKSRRLNLKQSGQDGKGDATGLRGELWKQ